MPVLLRRSGDLPEAGAYRTWCVVEGTVPPLPPARRLPDEGGRQERAFDAVADTWLAIARDLGGEPSARLALDNETEQEITRAIESLSGTVTLIVIAHRLSTVRKCDVLVMMKEGRIADVGDFETLRRRNVDFRRLVEMSSLERPNVA